VTPTRTELAAMVAWSVRAARTLARIRNLPEDELESAALGAMGSAMRSYDAARGAWAPHVRHRVRYALLDAAKIEATRNAREPLLDDMEGMLPAGVEDDETALARTAGTDALIVMGSPEEALLAHEKRAVLDREVQRLPRDDRQLYALLRRGLRWEDVAAELGTSIRTAQYRAEKIRERLRAALQAYADAG